MKIVQDDSTITISEGARTILHYRFVENQFKPYADGLYTPSGVQILRDSAPGHPHHHGLMYGVAVDNIHFWGEQGKGIGKEKHKSLADVKSETRNGDGRAGFTQNLEWCDLAGKLLLVERRNVAVLMADDLGATLVDWRCRLQTPPGKESMTFTGHHYYGLGLRFLKSMDTGGRFFNANDKIGPVVRGDERLTPTKWCAYTAKADGKPVTVAIFDYPTNFSYPSKMFTMGDAGKSFAYLAATLDGWKKPVVVKSDKPLELTYGVAVWDGEVDRATVEKLYQRWLKLCESK
jgi:hypothetical protein